MNEKFITFKERAEEVMELVEIAKEIDGGMVTDIVIGELDDLLNDRRRFHEAGAEFKRALIQKILNEGRA